MNKGTLQKCMYINTLSVLSGIVTMQLVAFLFGKWAEYFQDSMHVTQMHKKTKVNKSAEEQSTFLSCHC